MVFSQIKHVCLHSVLFSILQSLVRYHFVYLQNVSGPLVVSKKGEYIAIYIASEVPSKKNLVFCELFSLGSYL